MLEKNKDYLEMCISSTDCTFTQNAPTQISVDGHVYTPYMDLPNPGEFYILISKEKFEQMQAEIEHYKRDITRLQARADSSAELAKQWEINYDLLLKKIGFDTVEELVFYLTNDSKCDTLHEAISKLHDEVKYTNDKCMVLEQEVKVYAKALQDWKEGTNCPSPSAAKTLIESGWSWHHAYNEIKEKNRKLTDDVKSWQKATGYSTSEALLSAVCNDPDNVWRDATGCDSPQEAGCKINRLCDDICKLKGDYDHLLKLTGYESEDCIRVLLLFGKRTYQTMRDLIDSLVRDVRFSEANWQKATKCETPEAAATWITSYESACERGNRLAEMVEKLKEEVDSWKNVIGYSTPEDYMHERISGAFYTPFDYTAAWQKATGFSTPEKCSSYIDRLEKKLEDIKNLTEED